MGNCFGKKPDKPGAIDINELSENHHRRSSRSSESGMGGHQSSSSRKQAQLVMMAASNGNKYVIDPNMGKSSRAGSHSSSKMNGVGFVQLDLANSQDQHFSSSYLFNFYYIVSILYFLGVKIKV